MNNRNGIAIVGLNGSGKSTLGHMLAKETGYHEMDVEHYFFPEQRESRRNALEGTADMTAGALPFSAPRGKGQVEKALLDDIRLHPEFILCGVSLNWCEELLSEINTVFWLKTPRDIRINRIKNREEARWGARVAEGGDMYESQLEFRRMAAGLSESKVSDSVAYLSCDVVALDGTLPPEDNIRIIKDYLRKH